MPPLKQPTSLEEMATNVLVEYSIRFFRMCAYNGSLNDEFREGVAFIKNAISSRMPGTLAVELYNKILQEFASPTPHHCSTPRHRYIRIASGLLFDDKIIGVKCLSVIIFSLEQEDLIRIRGITELEFSRKIPHSLEILHLKHLTVFKYVKHCSDSDLATLSKQCEKLEHVDVSESDKVTDVGLHALASCHNLRYLSVACCSNVSLSSLIDFLSVNKTIRELFAWSCFKDDPGFDFRHIRNWDPTVYSSIESFTIDRHYTSDRDRRSIVAKFPNLRSIKIYGSIQGNNLTVLKSLSKLSKIDFISFTIAGWTAFEVFLESVGPQIHHLVLHSEINDTQRCLNTIFRLCKNLESLRFRCHGKFDRAKVVVPLFEKLQYLECTFFSGYSYDYVPTLELRPMSSLANLLVNGFVIGMSRIRSIILDHTTFPNLKSMALSEFRSDHDDTEYEDSVQIIKINNLDLQLRKINHLLS